LVGHDRYSVCGAVDEMNLDQRSFMQSIETQLDDDGGEFLSWDPLST
jgi:hypothetical protein